MCALKGHVNYHLTEPIDKEHRQKNLNYKKQ